MRPGGRHHAAALVAVLLAAGCIEELTPLGGAPMCESSSDCDQGAGEVCDEGICWGGPPDDLQFAAVLVPPPERTDLPLTPIPLLAIAPDGTIGGLEFPDAVRVHGRVLLACPDNSGDPGYDCGTERSIGATITIERPPAFPGGPPLSRTVVAAAAVPARQDAFSFLLPRSSDVEYRITITPDDTTGGESLSPGELAPPRQITLRAEEDQAVEWVLGDPADLKTIRGCVQNLLGNGEPYAGMQVTALGRWTELSPLVRASSRSVTGPDGCFTLQVPIRMLDTFDLLVKPAPGAILPTLRLSGEFVRDPGEGDGEPVVHWIEPLVMPSAPSPTTFRLPIEAQGSAGGQVRVPGATVRFETRFDPPPGEVREVQVSFSAEAVTSDAESAEPGVATVELYPGAESNRLYTVHVVPPADMPHHSSFGVEVPVGLGGTAQLLQPVTLGRRVALTGTAVAWSGEPVAGAPVASSASSLLRVAVESQAVGTILDELQFPSATTNESGAFLLWVDRLLVGEAAAYDLDVRPPAAAGAPSWTFEDIQVPADAESIDLGTLDLPDASYARGGVRDRSGEPVVGAELHLYQLGPDDFCTRVSNPDAGECEPPAYLRGIWASDDSGQVRVVLPDP